MKPVLLLLISSIVSATLPDDCFRDMGPYGANTTNLTLVNNLDELKEEMTISMRPVGV